MCEKLWECHDIHLAKETVRKLMTDAGDAARDRIGSAILGAWDINDSDELVRLMRKFADALNEDPPTA